MKRNWLIVIFIVLNIITGCTNQAAATIQNPPNTISTFIPVPTITFLPQSTADVSVAANNAINIQSVLSLYNNQSQSLKTITPTTAVLVKQNLVGYVLINYSKSDQIYVAVSFPINFQTSLYDISQSLKTYPTYSVTDSSLPAAIFRLLPTELSAFGEPETEGEPCDQFISGHINIANKKPLQGDFQFRCQFQDGRAASFAGKFSQ